MCLDRLSVTVPSVSSSALGYGAFLGIYANLSYQLLFGADRLMTSHFDVIGVALFFSTALRYVGSFFFVELICSIWLLANVELLQLYFLNIPLMPLR